MASDSKLVISGTANFKFDLEVRSCENFIVGALVAQARDHIGLPVAIRCQWKRIVEDREYIITDVSSNAYQPSCDDIGTYISVRVTPIEVGEFTGEYQAKYGPIELEASLTKTLEYILTSGGSKFSVK